MSKFILRMYKCGVYTKEDMDLFLKTGYITQEEYDSVIE